ncbi:MAG: class I SAM-dependent methyltransferase [Bacteriovoracaceae bacterium]|nr:class I SAM-dependent methyltransferase [Bacteriovoracaceae bacterium]
MKEKERVDIDEVGSPWREEHQSRYQYSIHLVNGKTILDMACGSGFGSELILKNNAASLCAVDLSDEALEKTRTRLKKFGSKNYIVEKQDGTNLNYEDEAFDVIFSIETVEHINNYKKFLSELERVLQKSGHLIISTPNAKITKPINGIPRNAFHVIEFTPKEFQELLAKYFIIEFQAGQHVKRKYGVVPFLRSFNPENLSFKQRINFLYWRLLLRFPAFIRDKIHKTIFGFSFYPDIDDYTFHADDIDISHVQYYICRKK